MKSFKPIVENSDLSIHENPRYSRTAVICRWKDAHRFRRNHPDVSVVGPLRTVRGIDLLFRSLLANPQIRRVEVHGIDLTPNESTTDALFDAWLGHDTWLQMDVVEHADVIRTQVDLVLVKKDEVIRSVRGSTKIKEDRPPVILLPPTPKASSSAPHGDPGQRVSGATLADLWPRALKQAMGFGRAVPTQYGETREVLNLVSVIRDPVASCELPEWIPGHDQVEVYAQRLFVDRSPPEGAKYTYSSRLHDGAGGTQLEKLYAMLNANPDTRAAYVTPWDRDEDAGLESGRPCMVGSWFRQADGDLHLTLMFRSHDLFAAYPLNLAAGCNWLDEVAMNAGLEVGTLTCISCSAHVYDRDYVSAESIIENRTSKSIEWDPRSTWSIESIQTNDSPTLRATALSPDGNDVLCVFEGRNPASVRSKIQDSGFIQSIGNAMWLGDELRRVFREEK